MESRHRTRHLALVFAILLVVGLWLFGCGPGGTDVGDAPEAPEATLPTLIETSSSTATTSVAAEPAEFAVLLSEVRSQANYYYPTWPDYADPLFALWPDGWVMVREKGGYSSPAFFLKAQLGADDVEAIRTWIKHAELGDLASTYPLPRRSGDLMIFDLPQWRLEIRDGDVSRQVTFEPGYPPSDRTYPPALKTLVDRLTKYRPPAGQRFVPTEIEVIVEERAPVAARGYYPLPEVYDLRQMTEILRTVDNVLYRRDFQGDEAAAIMARIDAGERLCVSEDRSYWVRYRPIVDWPQP